MNILSTFYQNNYFIILNLFILTLILRWIFNKFIFKILYRFFTKTKTQIDLNILKALHQPVNFLFFIIFLNFANSVLKLQEYLSVPIKILFAFFIFWSLHRLIEPLSQVFEEVGKKLKTKPNQGIINFAIKALKVLNFIIGFAMILQSLGYNVTGFVASLGIGGLAFALAAKDTASNLFGSLVIFSDKPFVIGDWIQSNDIEGVVEDIGIRSTKLRTFSQALVNVPNANLANSSIINWSRMGKRRIKMNIELTYSTSSTQMKQILSDIRILLKNSDKIHQDTIYIYFTDYNDSSLGIFCYFFTNTTRWGEYMSVKEEINLEIMSIIENNSASFAYPSQSIYLENGEK